VLTYRNERGENKNKKERLVSYLSGGAKSEFPPGPFTCRPEPPEPKSQSPGLTHVTRPPAPPTPVSSLFGIGLCPPWPPVWVDTPPSGNVSTRPPAPPGVPKPADLSLSPPVHILFSESQFNFANTGLAALKLVVAAVIIATVVIAITKSLVFCIMHGYYGQNIYLYLF
jgi:hypothetical protein